METTFGKYRLIERLASGGMAEVWRAEAPGPEGFVKEVALKLIRGDHDAQGEFVRMFIQEARLASRLTHANIVQVFDFDQVDGRYYLAMELVRGRTLREVSDRCRACGVHLGLARAVHIGAEVARALGYAHRRAEAVVHRDVSPQNVLISFEGEVKLADFGIARALASPETTDPGVIKGKLAYMSPEQARGEAVDARADVFALSTLLWELCTGRRLFGRASEVSTLAALLRPEPISAPSAWDEAVPADLDALILAGLERDPARRLADAEELAHALGTIRLRLANAHDDIDLRALMRQLWPDVSEGRPARVAVLEATRPREGRGGGAGGSEVESLGGASFEEASTRTLSSRRRLRPWIEARAGTGALLVMVAGVMTLGWGVAQGWIRKPVYERDKGESGPVPAIASPVVAVAPERVERPIEGLGEVPGAAPPPQSDPPPVSPSPQGPEAPRPVVAEVIPSRKPPTKARVSAPPRSSQIKAKVSVWATPWAGVTLDGAPVGETPLQLSLTPGVHRLRARHPRLGTDEVVVKLTPGQRYAWHPKLTP